MGRTTKGIWVPAFAVLTLGAFAFGAQPAVAEVTSACATILNDISPPSGVTLAGSTLYEKLGNAMTDGATTGKGLPLKQWGTIVDTHGVVCAVVTSAGPGKTELGKQWLGSRVISAQKANTALDYSISHGLALSTANLWAATQPGGSLFGLQFSNPVDTAVAYGDNTACGSQPGCDTSGDPQYGSARDPMVGHYVGGNNVFGGGLPLYDSSGKLIGALGTSGNTSCADHYISWVVRYRLGLDHVPAGVADGGKDDNIIFDVTGSHGNFSSKSGFGHPLCGVDPDEINYPKELEQKYPTE